MAFALAAAATFGLALVLTQLKPAISTAACAPPPPWRWPTWWRWSRWGCKAASTCRPRPPVVGLAALTFLYGTAFTIMFTVLPRLGVVGNSAIMNVEPVFALVLAWLILGQAIAPVQIAGALLVVGAVVRLGLRKR